MADEQLKPVVSASPSDSRNLRSTLAYMLRQHELRTDQMLPARVINFDRATNMATVKPLIMWLDVNDNQIPRHSIANVPVLSLGGGGFHISFPLAQGDLGWIYASDRDLSLFKQSLKETVANTGRAHRFEDSMFVPDVFRQYTVAGEDSGAMVLQSTDGATKVSIRPDNIKIAAPSKLLIEVPDTEITGNLKVGGNTEIAGMTNVNGGFSATGGAGLECSLPATTTVNGKQVDGHEHGGIQPGSGHTDPF